MSEPCWEQHHRGHDIAVYQGTDLDPDCYWWSIDGDGIGTVEETIKGALLVAMCEIDEAEIRCEQSDEPFVIGGREPVYDP